MAPLLSISIRMPQWSKNNERKLKKITKDRLIRLACVNENKAGETAVNGTWNSCQYNDVLERSCKTKAAGKREGPKRTQTKQNGDV